MSCASLMQNPEIRASSLLKRASSVIFSRLDRELLAVDMQKGECFSLSETAGRAWDFMSEPIAVHVLCVQLCAEYDVDPCTCEQEVIELLYTLREAGLVAVHEAPGAE